MVFRTAVPTEAPTCWAMLAAAPVAPASAGSASGVAGGRGDLGEQGGPGRADQQPGHHDGPDGDPGQEPAGDLGGGQAVDYGQGQEPEPGGQRGQVLDALQDVGEEQERPVVGEHGQGNRRIRAAPVAAGEDPQRKQRVGGAGLHRDEGGQRDHRHGQRDDHARAAPGRAGGLAEPVDQGGDAAAAQHRPRQVEADPGAVRPGRDGHGHADGDHTAIGTFTNTHDRQPRYWVSTPPNISPRAAPAVAMAAQIPNARPRSASSVKVVVSTASTAGASSAAKIPCSARAPTRTPGSGAAPPSAEAAANPATPIVMASLEPSRSLSRPPSSSSPPKVMV